MAETIRGMSNLKRAFKDLAKQGERNKPTALKIVGQECANDVKAKIPYKSGTLRRSVHVEPVSENTVLVGTDLVYAKQKEYGGVIKAKNAPYLVFQIDGQWVQIKQVYQAPQPAFRPAMDENWKKYQRMYAEALHLA